MNTFRTLSSAALAALALAGAAPTAQAAFIATMSEIGADVVVSGSGTLNLAGLSKVPAGSSTRPGAMGPNAGILLMGAPGFQNIDAAYTGFTTPGAFGTTGAIVASSGSGTKFGFGPDGASLRFELDEGLSNVLISSSSTYAGQSFASLGLTLGTYVWSWGIAATADTFTLNITNEAAAVPEPASLALLAAGITGLGLSRRRKA